jgi:cytochrome P450
MFTGWDTPDHPAVHKPGVNQELYDLRTLALRVVAGAALETKIPFSTATISEKLGSDAILAQAAKFSDDLQVVLVNLITFMIWPRWLIALSSKRGKELCRSFQFVGDYMRKMIAAGLQAEGDVKKEDRTLLRGLVNAIASPGTTSFGPKQLSVEEVTGNIFLLGLAGSETTANTIHYALVFLALHQEEQEYVVEELDRTRKKYSETWEYKVVYPKLKRLHHVMVSFLCSSKISTYIYC